MIYLILTLSAGICTGFIFRRSRFLKHTGTVVSAIICLMLFFMGVKIGADENILKNLSGLGLQALLFAIAGIAGSVSWSPCRFRTGNYRIACEHIQGTVHIGSRSSDEKAFRTVRACCVSRSDGYGCMPAGDSQGIR